MFSWMNKDADRLKHKDVYDSVTTGLQTTYREGRMSHKRGVL